MWSLIQIIRMKQGHERISPAWDLYPDATCGHMKTTAVHDTWNRPCIRHHIFWCFELGLPSCAHGKKTFAFLSHPVYVIWLYGRLSQLRPCVYQWWAPKIRARWQVKGDFLANSPHRYSKENRYSCAIYDSIKNIMLGIIVFLHIRKKDALKKG
jgi:hypothetical protein